VCVCSNDGTIRFWDFVKGLQVGTPIEHDDEVRAVCFNMTRCLNMPPGKLIASGSASFITLWDRRNEKQAVRMAQVQAHAGGITCITFHPLALHSNVMFTGGVDRIIKVWRFEHTAAGGGQAKLDLVEVATLKGHAAGLKTLTFSPLDPHLLSSGSSDATIRLWNYPITQATAIGVSKGHRLTTHAVTWSKDASLFISASADCTLRVWNGSTGVLHALLPNGIDLGFVGYSVQHIVAKHMIVDHSNKSGKHPRTSAATHPGRPSAHHTPHLADHLLQEAQKRAMGHWNLLSVVLFDRKNACAQDKNACAKETCAPSASQRNKSGDKYHSASSTCGIPPISQAHDKHEGAASKGDIVCSSRGGQSNRNSNSRKVLKRTKSETTKSRTTKSETSQSETSQSETSQSETTKSETTKSHFPCSTRPLKTSFKQVFKAPDPDLAWASQVTQTKPPQRHGLKQVLKVEVTPGDIGGTSTSALGAIPDALLQPHLTTLAPGKCTSSLNDEDTMQKKRKLGTWSS